MYPRTSLGLATLAAFAFAFAACDQPVSVHPGPSVPDDPVDAELIMNASTADLPTARDVGSSTITLKSTGGSDVITFDGAVSGGNSTSPPGPRLVEGDYEIIAFWWVSGSLFFGHFHLTGTDRHEAHHWNGDDQRQGIMIRRLDGEPFTLSALDTRNAFFFGNALALEVGTAPPAGVAGTPPRVTNYTVFSLPHTQTFQQTTITGFENVSEVWITSHLSRDWDNIVLEAQTNSPPIADAGPDQLVECTSFAGADVTLDGTGSTDPDGNIDTYDWFDAATLLATGATPTVTYPLGTHTTTLVVTDTEGLSDDDDVEITVEDTQAPTLDFTAEPTSLWPPNHKMRKVASGVAASDVCDPAPALALSVTSDEAVNGTGDGNTDPDWEIVDNGDGTFDVYVRAERNGNGDDRTYTITATATDASGNVTTSSGEVTVVHDRGRR